MSAYFIANIAIHDEAEYRKYLARVDEVFANFNGKYLAVDDHPEVLEGIGSYARIVLIEFPDREALRAWYDSDAYREIVKHRLNAADCDAILVSDRTKPRG